MSKKTVEEKRINEKKLVMTMIGIYCHGNHKTKRGELCLECRELAEYAELRISRCPFMETKTFCSACKVHCYKPKMREKIRQVMKYSGCRMLFSHPIITIKHGIVTIKSVGKEKKKNVQQKAS